MSEINEFTAGDRTPYTYVLECLPTGKRYYGVRFAKGCGPWDLWVTYFTSCRAVKREIKTHGKASFIARVRKTFKSIDAARRWENKVLLRLGIPSNKKWYNRTNNAAIGDQTGVVRSPETRRKMSASKLGSLNPQYGRPGTNLGKPVPVEMRRRISRVLTGRKRGPCPDQWKRAISLAKTGKKRAPFSDEWRRNMGLSRAGSKHWNFGKHFSEESKSKMRSANSVKVTCPSCGLKGGIRAMRRYHFENCKSI